jgi:hypothetical protein
MAHAIRASLLASAIAATLAGRRASNAVSQGRCLTCFCISPTFLQIQWGHTGQTSARSLYPDLLGSAVALRRQRPDVGIVSGANDFNRLSGYIRSRSQPGKHREREEVGFVVILLPARKTSGTSPPRGVRASGHLDWLRLRVTIHRRARLTVGPS